MFGVSLHLLFSLSMSGLFVWKKIRSDPFHKFIVFTLSQLWKVQFIYFFFFFLFNLYFCWSYSTAPTAHRRQRGRGRVQKVEFTNIVPEEEKEGIIRGKKGDKEEHREEKEKEAGEKREQYQQFHLEFSWSHHKPSIDCFRQLQLNIKPLFSKGKED